MEALLYFVVWGVFIFLMMRLGCGAHIMGQGHSKNEAQGKPGKVRDSAARWVPPKTDIDPVCGKSVMTGNAKPSVHAGNVYYFCSRECREVFEAAPDLYVGVNTSPSKLEHSHV